MRDQVRRWLEELGHRPADITDPAKGDEWAWHVVLGPGSFGVSVIARTGEPNIIVESFVALGLEAVTSRRGPDVAHRVRAAILRPRGRDVETEIHRNGKAWLRSTIGQEEVGKAALEGRIQAIRDEFAVVQGWVSDALTSGTLPR